MRGELIYLIIYFLPLATFVAGFFSIILWRKNLILIMISIELCFIASSIGFLLSSVLIDDALGFIFTLFSLTLAGAEISVGLALTIIVYRRFDSIFTRSLKKLKS